VSAIWIVIAGIIFGFIRTLYICKLYGLRLCHSLIVDLSYVIDVCHHHGVSNEMIVGLLAIPILSNDAAYLLID
jgi:hypothetical protein